MKKKILALICMVLITVPVLLTGCAKSDKLTVATNAEFEPFETEKDGEIVGFDIDLINEIAKKLGMEVELKNMEFDGIVAAIQSKTYKVAISGMTATPKREKSVLFSIPYYTTTQVLITKKDDTIFTGTTKEEIDAQLVGKTIGVCSGFTGEAYVKGDEDMGLAGIADATTKVYDNISLAVTDLKNGNIDAIVMDKIVAKNAAEADVNKDAIVVKDITLTTENYAIAINKNDTALKEKIDKALQELIDSGKVEELYKKWEIDWEAK
ncbi:basic amino acid ABC transporter substrate-binding protein [Eubacteriales bacterium OttesenSCG-928-G02]|nr:basic amino acid ABC transporter substrate-binding protein [Eubacteriales bacterium OttesenSCG-928-G02]